MKISFLVTYYNQEQFVKDSLDSILSINKPCDWEIIVGDDGSTDKTIQIVQSYIDKYPDYISLFIMDRDKNKKYDSVKRASANRLNILSKATGDFYCCLDGDDFYIDSNFVEDALHVFQNNPTVTAVAFGYKDIINGIQKNPKSLAKDLGTGLIDKKKYLVGHYVHAGSCVQKVCWDKSRLDYIKKIGYFDDNNILINTLNYGDLFIVDKYIYGYRQTDGSVYNSMSDVEQAVLNVQGMDIDIKLVDEDLKDIIIRRYSSYVLIMFEYRKQLKDILKGKYERYLENCKSIEDSIAYKIFEYDIEQDEKLTNLIKELKRKYWLANLRVKVIHLVRGRR